MICVIAFVNVCPDGLSYHTDTPTEQPHWTELVDALSPVNHMSGLNTLDRSFELCVVISRLVFVLSFQFQLPFPTRLKGKTKDVFSRKVHKFLSDQIQALHGGYMYIHVSLGAASSWFLFLCSRRYS